MKANTCDLNTRPRPTPASADSLMNADLDLVSLFLAGSQFQGLGEYLLLVQDFVVQKQRGFQKRVDDYIAANTRKGDDRDEYYSSLEDDHDQIHNRFPRIVYSSTLLMACALFEGSLVDLCKSLERTLVTSQPWGDPAVRDTGIAKAAAFLKKNFGIDLSQYSDWAQVKNYFKVRDCILHADGDISNMKPDQTSRIRETVDQFGSLGLRITGRHLVFEEKFVSAVINDLRGIWPLLETACIQNEVVGPQYWP
jgi:hypothetical protein